MSQGRVEWVNPSGVLGGHRKHQKCLWRTDLGEVGKRAPEAERGSDTRLHRKRSSGEASTQGANGPGRDPRDSPESRGRCCHSCILLTVQPAPWDGRATALASSAPLDGLGQVPREDGAVSPQAYEGAWLLSALPNHHALFPGARLCVQRVRGPSTCVRPQLRHLSVGTCSDGP